MRNRAARRPPLIRSIRTRLAVTFFLITALAIAVMYVVIAPPLTSGLQKQEINDLVRVATPAQRSFHDLPVSDPPCPADTKKTCAVRDAATRIATHVAHETVSQVTLVDVEINGTGATAPAPRLFAFSPGAPVSQGIKAFAGVVANSGAASYSGPASGAGGGLAAVGFVIGTAPANPNLLRIAVFSVSLHDVGGAVSLVRSRILLAAAIALLVALLTGVLVARALTVRVLRLERVAQRVAQGDFEAHFSDSSRDELGQLAIALADMQSQLEGLEEARRRFIATASHELRTPIFSLGGFLELIQDEDLDEETRQQFLSQVREQVDRLGKLATQLLDLSRLESGSVQLTSAPTDLGVLARAVSGEFVPALAQHDSQLELRLPNEPVRAICDPERVAQLLRILIDNALSHTESGTEVRVAVAPAENGTGASMSVHDQGPGIAEDALGRIFEPFYSADDAQGAGLGLAIARELAVQMGARLEVDSSAGDTTFTLILDAEAR